MLAQEEQFYLMFPIMAFGYYHGKQAKPATPTQLSPAQEPSPLQQGEEAPARIEARPPARTVRRMATQCRHAHPVRG